MKTMDPVVLLAIFTEMLGPLLWLLIAIMLLVPLAFIHMLWRDRGLVARRMLVAQALGLPGGIAALVLMATVSSSGYTDAGGPIDWLLIALIFVLGLLYTAMISYTLAGWLPCCNNRRAGCTSPEQKLKAAQ